MADVRNHMRRETLLTGLALVIGATLLRTYHLGNLALIPDELFTFGEARELFASRLEPGIHARPLYYLLQHAAFWILPETPGGLRVLPALFGILGVMMTWKLGREVFNARVGAIAGIVVAFSSWHLHVSAFGRYWSLVYLLSVSAYYFLWRAYTRGKSRDYWAAGTTIMLGLTTHPTFAFPLLGAGVACCCVRADGSVRLGWPSRQTLQQLWIPLLVFAVVAFVALKVSGSASNVRNHGGRDVIANLRLLPAIVQLMTPVVFVSGGVGIAALVWRGEGYVRVWGMIAGLGLVSGLTAILSASWVTNVYADYGIAMAPLFFVSSAGVISLFVRERRFGLGVMAWTLVLLAGMAPSTVSHFIDASRFDPRPAFEAIRREAPGVTVVSWPGGFVNYYAPDLRGLERQYEPGFFDRALAEQQDLWVIMRIRRYGMALDADGSVARWLYDHCRLRHTFGRARLDYRQYKLELYRCTSDSGP